MKHINGLQVDYMTNLIVVLAEDVEGSDTITELNRALHVAKVCQARENQEGGTRSIRIQLNSGPILSPREIRREITYRQKALDF